MTSQPIEKVKQLFEEIKKGRYSAKDEFFETLWVNVTRMAHGEEVKPLLQEIEDWANAHVTEHPDFFELMNLTIGSIEFHADNFESALRHLNKAIELFSAHKEEDGVAACYINIGFIHRSRGEIDLALKYGLPGLEQLSHSGKFQMFRIIGAYFVGGVYAETGHLTEALRVFQDALKVNYPAGIYVMGARLTNGIAGVYMKQKNFTLALENYQKALVLCDDTNTEPTFKARGLTDLADYYLKMGDYAQAITYNQQALAIRQEMNILNGSITNLMNLGDIYNKQGKFKDAVTVLTQALKLAEEIGVKVKMYQVHQLLSDIFLGEGNIAESLAHYKSFHDIREDVNHEDLDRKVKNQVQLFQAQQTEKENAIIKAQKIEIEKKNIELQETIDELTLTKISRKAKVFTLIVAITMFILEDLIQEFTLKTISKDNYFMSLVIKILIVFSLNPIDKAIEHYLVKKVIKKRKREVMAGS